MHKNEKSGAQQQQPVNADRRKVIKRAAQLAAAAYVAPATVQLLTATRATAQSAELIEIIIG